MLLAHPEIAACREPPPFRKKFNADPNTLADFGKDGGALPEVNSRQLASVRAVAEYRSFIAAAAYLGMSQLALTLTIKRLDQTLGLQLFSRTTSHVTLTAAGREFVAMAERVLNDLKLGMQSLRELTEQQRGQVIVSSLIPIGMSGVIVEYGRRFPGVEIPLREGLQDDVKDDVRSGLADIGIGELGYLPASHLTDDYLPRARRILIFDRTVDGLLLAVHHWLFPAHPGLGVGLEERCARTKAGYDLRSGCRGQ